MSVALVVPRVSGGITKTAALATAPSPGDDFPLTAMPAESSAAPEQNIAIPATFAELGVPAPLVEVLEDEGITAPFPVQAATLPDALAGRDILGRARTGSGKTLGFSLPLVSRLAGGATRPARPRGLVLVPTRELATQVTAVLKPLARAMDLWVTTIYGGVSYGPQVNALQRRTDIVVATPGRLADLIEQGECDLSDVEITVIDEADQMADLGFLPIVRRLLETTADGGQRMLFSATLDAAVDVLARRFLSDPVLHSVDEHSSPAEIEHHVLTVDAANRVAVIAALTGGEKRSLVFTRTKHGAERLARQLTGAGIPAAELHGNLRQGARSRNLAAFASGLARVMVATDIAARGIHIDGIDLVIHADPPAEHKAYVHRSGRTARGGADGVVVTLQTRAQARDVTAMMRKADITPHAAVAADAEAGVLTELAGPPAPRVSVDRKVAELVQPEDRLGRNDRPGVGKPWEGRPRRDRDRKPRNDKSRDHRPRNGAPRDRDGLGDAGRPAQGDARQAPRTDAGRDERPAFADRDRPRRFDGNQRPAWSDRNARGGRAGQPERGGQRFEDRGSGNRTYGDRQGRQDDRSGNDWYPRSGGRPAPGGYRNRDDRGSSYGGRSAGGDRGLGDSRPPRAERPFRDDRNARDERGGREERPFGGERAARPPRAGGNFGGSSRRPGYSAGRSAAGRRGDSGQGRHF
jgi:superfamily II DNA/RNA helicase